MVFYLSYRNMYLMTLKDGCDILIFIQCLKKKKKRRFNAQILQGLSTISLLAVESEIVVCDITKFGIDLIPSKNKHRQYTDTNINIDADTY